MRVPRRSALRVDFRGPCAALVTDRGPHIESESRRRKLSKSDVVRERLAAAGKSGRRQPALLEAPGRGAQTAGEIRRRTDQFRGCLSRAHDRDIERSRASDHGRRLPYLSSPRQADHSVCPAALKTKAYEDLAPGSEPALSCRGGARRREAPRRVANVTVRLRISSSGMKEGGRNRSSLSRLIAIEIQCRRGSRDLRESGRTILFISP